jgi:hypothetical protein
MIVAEVEQMTDYRKSSRDFWNAFDVRNVGYCEKLNSS